MKNLRPVLVEWIDSMSQAGWGEYQRDTDPDCASCGHLIDLSEKRVVLALNRSAYDTGQYITIPRVAVRRVWRLERAGRAMKPPR